MANHLAPPPRSLPYISQRQLSPGNASLYVGDLEKSVTEEQLFDLFNQVGSVVSVRVCRDLITQASLGYGYVNYRTTQEASRALEFLNFTPLNGKSIRLMFLQRDPTNRRSGYANTFIKNLDPSIDNKSLQDFFISFGPILSCKVATDINGQSKGYGFVQFENEESAQKAIGQLNGMLLNDRKVYVGLFMRRQNRDRSNGSPKFTNVFVKNFPATFTEEDLKKEFSGFGDTDSVIIMRDAHGNSKCFGFVNFTQPGAAAAAVEKLNGKTIDDKALYVGRAQKKIDREAELKAKFEQEKNGRLEKLKSSNLYLKNLDESVNDKNLDDLFASFGKIISCKVMLDSLMQSKGTAFVQFSSPEEAERAVFEMNRRMIGRKPLYVAVAQRKEERRAKLQAYFAQCNAPVNLSPPIPALPSYHPGPARLVPPQLYYGQGGPGLMTPQPTGFGFQQQIIPGMRPGVASNNMIPFPLQRHGQPAQRTHLRRGGMPQQMQQQMLGEQLYPLVEKIEHYQAGQITRMLLEMDQTEVLHLIESPDALRKKVGEAMKVLRSAHGGKAAHQKG